MTITTIKTNNKGNKMTKEDLQNRIEQIAYDGATDGCNQAVIEREASKLAREIVKLFTIQNVSKTFTAEEVVNELEDCDTMDDAIMFFKEQM